jgi:hypothetical protein
VGPPRAFSPARLWIGGVLRGGAAGRPRKQITSLLIWRTTFQQTVAPPKSKIDFSSVLVLAVLRPAVLDQALTCMC